MSRWFSIFLLPYLVCLISAQEQEGRNSLLARPIHPRRHKRAEQVRSSMFVPSPFLTMTIDPQCMIAGRDMLSCPKKYPEDSVKCIEAHELCDDHRDCDNGEDEDPHFCMFKKLEDAELRRIATEIRLLRQGGGRKVQPQPEEKEVIVVETETQTSPPVKQPSRTGVFKLKPGKGPLAKAGYNVPKYDTTEYGSEEEESEGDGDSNNNNNNSNNESEAEARQHTKRRRAYRHLLDLKAARF